jgi:large subunit ribosomal protein L15
LHQCGLVKDPKDGIKLLAKGPHNLITPIDIMVSRASSAAIDAVEKAGGKVTTRYYTKRSIEWILADKCADSDKPLPYGPEHVEAVLEARRRDGRQYRLPDPTSRKDIEYYRDPAHRGYLSHMLKPGESPSLYFRVPALSKPEKRSSRAGKLAEDNDRLF